MTIRDELAPCNRCGGAAEIAYEIREPSFDDDERDPTAMLFLCRRCARIIDRLVFKGDPVDDARRRRAGLVPLENELGITQGALRNAIGAAVRGGRR